MLCDELMADEAMGSDQARSDRCVTYLPSSAKVVALSGNYSVDFAINSFG
jgi:hypothetical protein